MRRLFLCTGFFNAWLGIRVKAGDVKMEDASEAEAPTMGKVVSNKFPHQPSSVLAFCWGTNGRIVENQELGTRCGRTGSWLKKSVLIL
jgi:hypothetical protein